MKLPRRQFLHLAAGAAAVPAVSRIARAQAYPSRPVRIVVGFPAGGQIDIIARLMGQWLSDRLGQQFYIDNRPGAASNVAAEAVVRAPADGHTLFLANGTNAVNATLYDNLRFDFLRDTEPVVSLCGRSVLAPKGLSWNLSTSGLQFAATRPTPSNVNARENKRRLNKSMAARIWSARSDATRGLNAWRVKD